MPCNLLNTGSGCKIWVLLFRYAYLGLLSRGEAQHMQSLSAPCKPLHKHRLLVAHITCASSSTRSMH